MTLYLYQIGTNTPVLTMENVISYSSEEVVSRKDDGTQTVFAPLAEDCELSSKADCSETLRADWRVQNPTDLARIEELEALMAGLLFGFPDEGGADE